MGMVSKVYWHEHTMRELKEIMGKLEVVIIPTGSTEIHGSHLGTGTDILLASKVCEDVVKILYPRALVCNVLWIGYTRHTMSRSFVGSITLRAETYIQVLCEVAESLMKHGVKRIVFVNGHGGNIEPNKLACDKIREELHHHYGVDLNVGCLSYWDVIPAEIWKEVIEGGDAGAWPIGHGGEVETSLLMAVAPRMVRSDYMKAPETIPHGFPGGMKVLRTWYVDEYYAHGNTDDPRLANEKKGRKLLDAAVNGTVAALEDFIKYEPPHVHKHPENHKRTR